MQRMRDDARLAYHKARYDAAAARVERLEKSVKVSWCRWCRALVWGPRGVCI